MQDIKSLGKFTLVRAPRLVRAESKFELKSEPEAKLDTPGVLMKNRRVGKGQRGLPPQLDITPTVRHTFRFYQTVGGHTAVTVNNVFGALGGVCYVANSLVKPMASSFKIHKVTIYPAPNLSGTSACNVAWALATGAQMRDEEKDRTLPEGLTVTSPVESSPPRGSLAAMWQVGSTNSLFFTDALVGSVLDMDISFTLSNQFVVSGQTVVTGTLGNIYYLYLDGSTSHNWIPVGFPTTT
jgi:hypothetical protein